METATGMKGVGHGLGIMARGIGDIVTGPKGSTQALPGKLLSGLGRLGVGVMTTLPKLIGSETVSAMAGNMYVLGGAFAAVIAISGATAIFPVLGPITGTALMVLGVKLFLVNRLYAAFDTYSERREENARFTEHPSLQWSPGERAKAIERCQKNGNNAEFTKLVNEQLLFDLFGVDTSKPDPKNGGSRYTYCNPVKAQAFEFLNGVKAFALGALLPDIYVASTAVLEGIGGGVELWKGFFEGMKHESTALTGRRGMLSEEERNQRLMNYLLVR